MSSPDKRLTINHKNLTIDSKADDQYADFTKTTSPGGGSDTIMSFESNDDIIPPTHRHRTLVLCFDGTGIPLLVYAMRRTNLCSD